MNKLINIPDEFVKDLKKLAIDEGKSFKKFIEDKLIELVKNSEYYAELTEEEEEYLDRQ